MHVFVVLDAHFRYPVGTATDKDKAMLLAIADRRFIGADYSSLEYANQNKIVSRETGRELYAVHKMELDRPYGSIM